MEKYEVGTLAADGRDVTFGRPTVRRGLDGALAQ